MLRLMRDHIVAKYYNVHYGRFQGLTAWTCVVMMIRKSFAWFVVKRRVVRIERRVRVLRSNLVCPSVTELVI